MVAVEVGYVDWWWPTVNVAVEWLWLRQLLEVVGQVLDGRPGDRLGMVLAIQQKRGNATGHGSGDDVVASSLTSLQCGDGPLRCMTWRADGGMRYENLDIHVQIFVT
jgi:hypothetical protein